MEFKLDFFIKNCANCAKHINTTAKIWHQEAYFMENFNKVGDFIKEILPNSEVYGNFDFCGLLDGFESKPCISEFTVFTVGVGVFPDIPTILFTNRGKGPRWPNLNNLYNQIVDLVIKYDNAKALEEKQEDWYRINN